MTSLKPIILYKDTDVLVINKPAGLLSHGIKNTTEVSVSSMLASYIADHSSDRPGIVHRLDKDTSGVMIVARNTKAKHFLQAEFKARKVEKSYLALVYGKLTPIQARLELPLRRSYTNPTKMQVHKNGKEAISQYQVQKYFKKFSFITVQIFTGRTHQIRAQLSYLGHPVVGDKQYSNHSTTLSRQFLHAHSLVITLPSGEQKTFTAPLSTDLQEYLHTLQ